LCTRGLKKKNAQKKNGRKKTYAVGHDYSGKPLKIKIQHDGQKSHVLASDEIFCGHADFFEKDVGGVGGQPALGLELAEADSRSILDG
jgi:hypothetical protein